MPSRLGGPASGQSADIGGNLGQVVVELVIAAVKPMHDGAWYRFLIKSEVRERHDVVLAAVIEMDRHLWRQSHAEVGPWLDVFARPAAGADKGRRDEKDAGELPPRRRRREGVDQNHSAKRVTDQDRAIVEAGDLFRERGL